MQLKHLGRYHSRDLPTLPLRVLADILDFGECSRCFHNNFLRCMATHKYWSQIIFHSILGILGILQRIDLNFSSAAQDMRSAMAWRQKVCTLPNSFYVNVGKQILGGIARISDWSFSISTIKQQISSYRATIVDRQTQTKGIGGCSYMVKTQKKTRKWYNRTSDRMYIALKSGQNLGVILGKHKMPRSYLVQNYRENVIRRTSKDLRHSYNHHTPVKN
ncbi:hypothetical protein PR048_011791 [Dryococelus australis]|uniref:Uncharacterized protein n=1 Tax=Dryococelus australis TaxID=614101 RepID=A0ABQ9HNV8_9NEOP|nr:hypothetical protein PR048_011791 [Dryococelus australis]